MKQKLKKGKIESIYKLTMPELFDTTDVKEEEILPCWEKYTYFIKKALPLEQVMEIIDEQYNLLFLYHYEPSNFILCGHKCCYVSTPEADHMVKISVSTDENGLCDRVHLTIYHSIEIMIDDIMKENHYMQSKHEFNFNETMGNYIKLFI